MPSGADEPVTPTAPAGAPPGAFDPLRHPLFRAFWLANLASMVGTWVQQVGSAWLMASIATSPLQVALVQAAASLPMFLLALPAGALADVLDRRRLLVAAQAWMMACATALGLLTLSGAITPGLLLLLTALLGTGMAIHSPTWQAAIPALVPRRDLPAAVALGSVGFNLARSVGPALGGLLVARAGPGAAFLLNAASFLGVLAVATRWRSEPRAGTLPAERMLEAIRGGLRYVRHEPGLQAVIVRGAVFVVCGVGLWALLPVVVKSVLGLSATHYGLLLGCLGLGAVLGALALARLRSRIPLEALVVGSTLVLAAVVAGVARVRRFELLALILLPGGAAWLGLLSSLNTAVQMAVPSWVRGRAISVYLVAFFGGHAGGSALWGGVAAREGCAAALDGVSLGLLLGLLVAPFFRLPRAQPLDLSPSQHWPALRPAPDLGPDDGPILVVIEYRAAPDRPEELLQALGPLRRIRLRNGASAWSAWHDADDPARVVEQFLVDSWLAHQRHGERFTVADRDVLDRVQALHVGQEPPVVRHLTARRPRSA